MYAGTAKMLNYKQTFCFHTSKFAVADCHSNNLEWKQVISVERTGKNQWLTGVVYTMDTFLSIDLLWNMFPSNKINTEINRLK